VEGTVIGDQVKWLAKAQMLESTSQDEQIAMFAIAAFQVFLILKIYNRRSKLPTIVVRKR
jgi:hypothetical protein